jgi:Zinc knuckle
MAPTRKTRTRSAVDTQATASQDTLPPTQSEGAESLIEETAEPMRDEGEAQAGPVQPDLDADMEARVAMLVAKALDDQRAAEQSDNRHGRRSRFRRRNYEYSDEDSDDERDARGPPPKFTDHGIKYTAKSMEEYRNWVARLERNHRYYHNHFRTEEAKIIAAERTLKEGSTAATKWGYEQHKVDMASYTWQEFKILMLSALGTDESRSRDVTYAWFDLKWDPYEKDKNKKMNVDQLLNHVESLEDLMRTRPDEQVAFWHFYRLLPTWAHRRLNGDSLPATREKLAAAMERMLKEKIDSKKEDDKKDPKGDGEKTDKPSKKGRGRKRAGEGQPSRMGDAGDKRAKQIAEGACFKCGKEGHIAKYCRSSQGQNNGRRNAQGNQQGNRNRFSSANTEGAKVSATQTGGQNDAEAGKAPAS